MNTQKHWELHGEADPYWAVLTDNKFRGDIDSQPELRDEFFQTGRQHINNIFDIITSALCPTFAPSSALDFGCGVARLLVPLAERGLEITGIDISRAMLAVSAKNLASRNLPVAALEQSLDDLPDGKKYDFVHSYIVLQHIPVRQGLSILEKLLNRTSETGVSVLHVSYAARLNLRGRVHRLYWDNLKSLVLGSKGLTAILRLIRGKKIDPPMLMSHYPLGAIFSSLNCQGFNNIHVRHTQHGSVSGIIVFAQRSQTIAHPEFM